MIIIGPLVISTTAEHRRLLDNTIKATAEAARWAAETFICRRENERLTANTRFINQVLSGMTNELVHLRAALADADRLLGLTRD